MRSPTISTYVNSTYRLGNLTSSLERANEVVSTQKQINEISDDPLGNSQVLSLKNSIGNLEQIEQNVFMGISWLEGEESALSSVNDLILEAKTEVHRLVNASATQDERENAVERINSIIEQIVSLGNTQVNGSYVFGGTDTDIIPLEFDQTAQQVLYKGNENPFEIRTDRNSGVAVGRDGKETFWDDTVQINSTNNTIVFKEDNGHGSASEKILTAVIPDGTYTTETIEIAVKNAVNEASKSDGYGATYMVTYNSAENKYDIREDGSFEGFLRTEFMWEDGGEAHVKNISASSSITPEDINVTVVNKDALTISTPEPHGTEPFRLVWQGDGVWDVVNNPGYVILPFDISGKDDYIGIDLNESGMPDITISLDNPVTTRGQYIEFEIVSSKGDHSIGHEIGFNAENTVYEPPTSDSQASFVTELVIGPGNQTIEFQERPDASGPWSGPFFANITNDTYTDMDALSAEIEKQMKAASGTAYAVSYDPVNSKFNIREDGTTLDEIEISWASNPATATTLGYYPVDDIITYPTSGVTMPAHVIIDDTNNQIAFREDSGSIRWATVAEGTYKSMGDLGDAVATAITNASGVGETYTASYDDSSNEFSIEADGLVITDLDLLWSTADLYGSSIGETLGFDSSDDTGGLAHISDEPMVLMTFDETNNVIDFEEISLDGTISTEVSITIPEGEYTNHSDVAAEIESALRLASPNNVDYQVEYDVVSGEFMIKGSDKNIKGFTLLWQTGPNREQSAGDALGFYGNDTASYSESDEPIVNITIYDTGNSINNKIDFLEFNSDNPYEYPTQLTATVKAKTYTSHAELAREIEKALEDESNQKGNGINYLVTWDDHTKKFTIKENGSTLDKFQLQWNTGNNAPPSVGGTGESIGSVLGFDYRSDDINEPLSSSREVSWGIFDTLIDLKQYLSDNDVDGIERSIGRLEANFDNMTSTIVDVGMKYSRLEVRQTITREVSLSLTERRSSIEDADIVESIMKLQNIEVAYQAALASSSRILNISIVDYLR